MVESTKSNQELPLPGRFRRIINGGSGLQNLKEGSSEDEQLLADEHRIPLKRLLDRYESNIAKGLDNEQVVKNRIKYGMNIFEPNKAQPFKEVKKIAKSFVFGLNSLIWLCALLSLATAAVIRIFYPDKHSYDGEVWNYTNANWCNYFALFKWFQILFGSALILVTAISGFSFYYQEAKSTRIVESFNNMITPQFVMVKRNGHFKEVDADEVVVGDIVKLTYGDIIPADIRLFECHEFFVDNSSLTGESDPKRRLSVSTDSDPMETKNLVFYSTHAVEGHAKGIVFAVGSNTVLGKMVQLAGTVEVRKSKSPIVEEIDQFIKNTSISSLIIGLSFLFLSIALRFLGQDSVSFFTQIIISSIPEGLHLSCTVLYILMAKRMTSRNVLVKNLHSLEVDGIR